VLTKAETPKAQSATIIPTKKTESPKVEIVANTKSTEPTIAPSTVKIADINKPETMEKMKKSLDEARATITKQEEEITQLKKQLQEWKIKCAELEEQVKKK